jgi:hypothetical protein
MKFVPKNPSSFRNALAVLKSINGEIYAIPKEKSVVFWTIDPAKTILYSAVMPKSSMLIYEVEGDEIGRITAYDVKYLEKALKKVKADTPFTFDQTPHGYTEITIDKPFKVKARVPQLSTDMTELELPEIPFEVFLTGYGALFQEVINTIKSWHNVVRITAFEDKIVFKGENDVSEVEIEITPEDDWVQEYELDEEADPPIKAYYDLNRLSGVLKGISKSSVVDFFFGTERPLYVHWEDTDGFKHQFLLAPRVDEE